MGDLGNHGLTPWGQAASLFSQWASLSYARGGRTLGQKLRHLPLAAIPHKSHLVSLPVNVSIECILL